MNKIKAELDQPDFMEDAKIVSIYVRVSLYNRVIINMNKYVCINSDRQVHIL